MSVCPCRGWLRRRTCWLRLSNSSLCEQRCFPLTSPSEWLRRSSLLESLFRCLRTTTTARPELVLYRKSALCGVLLLHLCLCATENSWTRYCLVSSGSILKHQEDIFAAELHRLKQQPLFSLVDFENLIDRIRSTVAEVSLNSLYYFFLSSK